MNILEDAVNMIFYCIDYSRFQCYYDPVLTLILIKGTAIKKLTYIFLSPNLENYLKLILQLRTQLIRKREF